MRNLRVVSDVTQAISAVSDWRISSTVKSLAELLRPTCDCVSLVLLSHHSGQVFSFRSVRTVSRMSSYQKQDESSISSLCPRCKAMTTTITGLKQLFSKTGYVHPYPSILYGSSDGCRFCIILKQLALLRIEEVPNPVHISCAFPVDGSNEFDDLVYRGQSCSDDEFQRLYESLPPGAFRPGIFITFQGHAFGPDYCASLDVKALPGTCLLKLTSCTPVLVDCSN